MMVLASCLKWYGFKCVLYSSKVESRVLVGCDGVNQQPHQTQLSLNSAKVDLRMRCCWGFNIFSNLDRHSCAYQLQQQLKK